jgi:hypothetical protein
MLEERHEGRRRPVRLRGLVEFKVLGGDFPVKRDVAGGSSWTRSEAVHDVSASKLPEKVELEVDVGEPF